jgi:hypothetical protein
MHDCRSKTLIAVIAGTIIFSATSPVMAQLRPSAPVNWAAIGVNGQANNQFVPPNPFPSSVCFEWIDFEHAWARQSGSPAGFQVNPAGQPAGFNSYGYEWKVPGSGYAGTWGWPIDLYNSGGFGGGIPVVNQIQTGPIFIDPYSNSRTASASSGSSSATATASTYMATSILPPYNQLSLILGTSISGSATGGTGSAYKYASSTARGYVGQWVGGQPVRGQAGITWGWFLAGTSNVSGLCAMGASEGKEEEEYDMGAPAPSIRHVSVAKILAADGSVLLQDTLADASSTIDFSMEEGVEASIRWEADQVTFTNVRDGRFCVRISGNYVNPEDQGEIDIRKHNGVVTTSRATGVFYNTALPSVGTSGDFVIDLPQTAEMDCDITTPAGPDLYTFDFDSTTSEGDLPAIWGGDGTDANWSSQGNWLYAAPPESDVPIYFTGLLPEGQAVSNNDLPAGTKINALIFRPEVNVSYTLQGNSIVLDGLIQNTSDLTQQINLDIALPLDGASFDTLSADLVIEGVISGEGDLRKIGDYMLTFNRANIYSGPTFIGGGVLALSTNGQIDTSSSIYIDSGAMLRVSDGTHTVGDVSGTGTVAVLGGTLTTSSLNGNTILLDGGTLSLAELTGGYLALGDNINAVPEPSAFALLGIGAAMFFVYGQARRRQ